MTKTYAYVEISEWLRTEARRRGPSALMPTIADVCERFDVGGVQTVRDAYAPLIEEGVVERLESPRRWAVVDHGQEAEPAPEAGARLAEIEATLTHALGLVRDLRLNGGAVQVSPPAAEMGE
ncbi:hypothetical protein AAG589_21060 [Isoptericola sp. F-RaC21]|uniref:hypothetical protein n=1 Tax=Isoptericola sp. F-RaC21 TaxID=3141452 RepID=UPI00315C049A